MNSVILYVDDGAYACQQLDQLLLGVGSQASWPRHWILVGCAPRVTRGLSKWVSHSARENWRRKWFGQVQAALLPRLREHGATVTPLLANGPLTELTRQLQAEHGPATAVDARRPKRDEASGPSFRSALGLGAVWILVQGLVLD